MTTARATAAVRLKVPSFSAALRVWNFTVATEISMISEISLIVLPSAPQRRTSFSRPDKGMFQRAANRTRLSRLQFSRQQRSLLFLPLLPQRP